MNWWKLGWLVAANVNDPRAWRDSHAQGTTGLGVTQLIALLGAILGVGAVIFLVVYLVKRDRSGDGGAAPHHHGGGRRRRLREHRPRNPTLAETGGLPPLRPDDPSRPS